MKVEAAKKVIVARAERDATFLPDICNAVAELAEMALNGPGLMQWAKGETDLPLNPKAENVILQFVRGNIAQSSVSGKWVVINEPQEPTVLNTAGRPAVQTAPAAPVAMPAPRAVTNG